MEAKQNYPDRINISKRARETADKIDDTKYFALQDSAISRSDLFSLAMAIGVDTAIPTKLENTYPGGLILDKITEKDAVYSFAQEYANTGFEVLADYMHKKNSELIWSLLEELDSQYDKIIEKEGISNKLQKQ